MGDAVLERRSDTPVATLSLTDYRSGDPARRAAFCEALFASLQTCGFVIVQDHGVPEALLQQAYDQSAAFFALPEARKRAHMAAGGQRGYTPVGTEHAKNSDVGDLKEFWHIGPERPTVSALGVANVWPDEPAGFKATFTGLYDALHGVGEVLLEALTDRLGVPADFFASRVVEGDSILRLLHYPPVPADADPRAVRAAAHEDINAITLLVAAQGAGLELQDADGSWRPVHHGPSDIVVDTGDMLARLTNDVLPATPHRVVNPTGPNVSRYSMPFFMHFAADVTLECLESCRGDGAKYPPITAGAYLTERLVEIGLIDPPAAPQR